MGIYARHVLRQRVQRIRLLLARQQSCAGRLDRLGGAGRVHAGRGIFDVAISEADPALHGSAHGKEEETPRETTH